MEGYEGRFIPEGCEGRLMKEGHDGRVMRKGYDGERDKVTGGGWQDDARHLPISVA